MSCATNKLGVLTLFCLAAVITNVQASCWRYGHSCWGGHGKRSGGGGGSGKRILDESEPGGNPGPSEFNYVPVRLPVFSLDDEPSISMSSGSTSDVVEPIFSGSVETTFRDIPPRKFLSMKPQSPRTENDLLHDKVWPAYERTVDKGGVEELSSKELYDYGQQSADDSLIQPRLQRSQGKRDEFETKNFPGFDRSVGLDVRSRGALDSSSGEELTRTTEVSTRKHPLNNLFMYKLIRLRRRK